MLQLHPQRPVVVEPVEPVVDVLSGQAGGPGRAGGRRAGREAGKAARGKAARGKAARGRKGRRRREEARGGRRIKEEEDRGAALWTITWRRATRVVRASRLRDFDHFDRLIRCCRTSPPQV